MRKRRTIQKYLQKAAPEEVLVKCVDAAEVSSSGANMQPLRYVIDNDQKLPKKGLQHAEMGWIFAKL